MNCHAFQDQLSPYLEGTLDTRNRAECAAHRLACRECRALYDDVRGLLGTLGELSHEEIAPRQLTIGIRQTTLEERLLAATTTGEMLSCREFDQLIERYFDGVLLASEFQTFQNHFESCPNCGRLITGIEGAIDLCREVKEADLAVPATLQDRILSATSGSNESEARPSSSLVSWQGLHAWLVALGSTMLSPQWAVALLILAAGSLLVSQRFDVEAMANQANHQAERLLDELEDGTKANLRKASFRFNKLGSLVVGRPAQPAYAVTSSPVLEATMPNDATALPKVTAPFSLRAQPVINRGNRGFANPNDQNPAINCWSPNSGFMMPQYYASPVPVH